MTDVQAPPTNINHLNFHLRPYQQDFVESTARYPALIAGIATGKTLCAILRAVILSEKYPGNLGLIVRKEFTDLRDSTMRDFENYTGLKISSSKDFTFPNGSQIMFRHASEVAVLKNINLGWAYIEQAEEFETDEQFQFLRDRLRRQGGVDYRCMFIIANANGHNWIYKNWIADPKPEFSCVQATTFDNQINLTPDFVDDLKRMETEAPLHFRQYVLNDHSVQDVGDVLFPMQVLEQSYITGPVASTVGAKIIVGVDVARFGSDRTVFSAIKYIGGYKWEQVFCKVYQGADLMTTAGRLVDLCFEYHPTELVIDDIGVGGGLVDRMFEISPKGVNITPYHANGEVSSTNKDRYVMRRDEDYFALRTMFDRGNIKILNIDDQNVDLNAIRFEFKSGKKTIVSKDKMKKLGYRSPDTADPLSMAVSVVGNVYSTENKENRRAFLDGYKLEKHNEQGEVGRWR